MSPTPYTKGFLQGERALLNVFIEVSKRMLVELRRVRKQAKNMSIPTESRNMIEIEQRIKDEIFTCHTYEGMRIKLGEQMKKMDISELGIDSVCESCREKFLTI